MSMRRISIWVMVVAIPLVVVCAVTRVDEMGGVEPAAALAPQSEGRADRPITSLRDFNDARVELAETVNPTVVTVFTERVLRVRQSPSFFFDHPFNDFSGEFFQ